MGMNAKLGLSVLVAAGMGLMVACEEKKPTSPAVTKPSATAHDHDHDHDHDHGHDHAHGAVVKLGMANVGSFLTIATREEGKVEAGKDVGITVSVSAAPEQKATAKTVRVWIGSEDGKGAMKAKAEVEDAKKAPNDWHAHTEVPKPLAEGSKVWVEIEDDKGATATGSYDLK